MNNIYDALEICLQEIENGADVEAVLLRYPDLADELRPILETSAKAKELSVSAPSADVVRRNRAKILQRVAEMSESKIRPVAIFNWFAPLRRTASVLVILAMVFASGTSLVGAASTSLPGENLYSVKRSWENMQVFFTFNALTREALEVEHENERLEEVREIFASGRSAEVSFSGLVTRQTGTEWRVAGIPVVISPQTDLPNQPVQKDSAVRVVGLAQADGSVLAQSIELLSPDASLPEVEEETDEGESLQNENESVSGSENEAPEAVATSTPKDSNDESFSGILDVLNGDFWTINGVPADVTNAEVIGTPAVGAAVIVEGYFNSDGVFIVTIIEFVEGDSNSGSDSNSNDNNNNDNNNENNNDNSNDNSNNNSNDNDNNNGNDNDNDNDGGDD